MGKEELDVITRVFNESSNWRVGFRASDEIVALENDFCRLTGASHCIALNGGNSALDLIWRALDIGPGDEILSSSLNFHGCHLSILGAGAKPILCDSDPVTFNLCSESAVEQISKNTRAILITHLHGRADDGSLIDNILSAAESQDKPVHIVVDAARSLGAEVNDRLYYGACTATVYSLQSKKTITALGEGGIVLTEDGSLANKLREMRAFGLGSAWGSNYKMSKLQAAVARVQLGRLPEISSNKLIRAAERARILSDLIGVGLPRIDKRHALNFFPVLLHESWTRARRDRLIELLAQKFGIGCVVANPPTYQYNSWIAARVSQRTPKMEQLANRLICPSFHPFMTQSENEEISVRFVETVRRMQ